MSAGCCVDGSCTPDTCMDLSDGKTCGDCAHCKRCLAFGFTESATSDGCSFFPRRFRLRVVAAVAGGAP